ncbi:MAG: tRNA 2-thiouridine(34) synthase MnmA [Clostridia bacterium]|nr:tRNA 2-thiouridine(34) synthase MnmA [Clostridia bacterium]
MAEKVILGLSGGVDSAVSARLLSYQGFEVHGLFLDIGTNAARQNAKAVSDYLGIPLHVLDIRSELEQKVCSGFAQAYARGETPNPCIMCNPAVKFRALIAEADSLGAKYVATGHYARTENGKLYKGHPSNDQSYMLCRLTRGQVARLLLPLGDYEKNQVRAMAEDMALPVAKAPDSMEICFIPEGDYVSWLESRGVTPPGGNFVFHGEILGRHDGIHRWTVGQRLPGLFNERKLYVSGILPDTNEIVVALWEELFKTEITAHDMNWLIDRPKNNLRASVKVRHTKWECPPCTVYPDGDAARIVCDEPVRAPAAGQSAVLYDGDEVIGGGYICSGN